LIFIKARNKRTCNKLNMTINQRSERKNTHSKIKTWRHIKINPHKSKQLKSYLLT